MINNKTILITGGTGSFGSKFARLLLKKYKPKKLIIFSRDELKQSELKPSLEKLSKKTLIRFFIGDVRDKERLNLAFYGVDIVFHAAALKQVDSAEYNPSEVIKTNIVGAENVISASLKNNVDKVLALSTDKACSPINLYGATKLVSDKLFISANNIKGKLKTKFSVLRYGNVMASRGSVIPHFLNLKMKNLTPMLTDPNMTRFSLTLEQSFNFALLSLKMMIGGELFVPKIATYKILDLIEAIGFKKKPKIIGLRPGEKINEELISKSDSVLTFSTKEFYIIRPHTKVAPWSEKKFLKVNKIKKIIYCKKDFSYSSDNTMKVLTKIELKKLISQL
jgi:UDP-N-acetylglucosamine 4,6-dehydratase